MCSFYCVPDHGNCHVMPWTMQAVCEVELRHSETRYNGNLVVVHTFFYILGGHAILGTSISGGDLRVNLNYLSY